MNQNLLLGSLLRDDLRANRFFIFVVSRLIFVFYEFNLRSVGITGWSEVFVPRCLVFEDRDAASSRILSIRRRSMRLERLLAHLIRLLNHTLELFLLDRKLRDDFTPHCLHVLAVEHPRENQIVLDGVLADLRRRQVLLSRHLSLAHGLGENFLFGFFRIVLSVDEWGQIADLLLTTPVIWTAMAHYVSIVAVFIILAANELLFIVLPELRLSLLFYIDGGRLLSRESS